MDNQPAQKDSSVDDIMVELKKMQREMKGADSNEPKLTDSEPAPSNGNGKSADPVEDAMKEFRAEESGGASLEETIGDLGEKEASGGGLLDDSADDEDPVKAAAEAVRQAGAPAESSPQPKESPMNEPKLGTAPRPSSDGSLTLEVAGDLKLNLKYQFSGQVVTLGFQNDYLIVTMSDGTEFKLPVKKPHLKAA